MKLAAEQKLKLRQQIKPRPATITLSHSMERGKEMKKVKDMTDEELNKAFDREYKETWLKYNRSRKILTWVTVIVMVPILLLIVCGLIIPIFMLI